MAVQDERRTEAESRQGSSYGASAPGPCKLRETVDGMRSAGEHSDGEKMQERLGALETRFGRESGGIATGMRSNLERSRDSAEETIRALERPVSTPRSRALPQR